MIEYAIYTGKDLYPFFADIARLRIEVFAEWPYRYKGDMSYEEIFLKKFAESKEAFCVVAKDGNRVIGVSTALPLSDEMEKMQTPFIKKGYDPKDFFYLSDTVLEKPYRGQGIGGKLVEIREERAKENPKYTYLCVAAIEREDAPPNSSKDLSSSRIKQGFTKDPDLDVFHNWIDIGKTQETPKRLVFWVKPL